MARETLVADEERRNVQLVADFIERENAEAERRRAEEEEIQRQEMEIQRQEEEARRESLRNKFHSLAVELEDLHDYQRMRIQSRLESEGKELDDQFHARNSLMGSRHAKDVETQIADSVTIIGEMERQLENDYASRAVEEAQEEATYLSWLRAQWKDTADLEYHLRQSRNQLRERQEQDFQKCIVDRRDRISDLKEQEKMKKDWLENKHRSEVNEAERWWKVDKVEERRKVNATAMWVGAVIVERRALLRDLEEEVLGDAQIRVLARSS